VVAFEAFRRLRAVAVKPMTAISNLGTIHDHEGMIWRHLFFDYLYYSIRL
jgi:hypothetical protein